MISKKTAVHVVSWLVTLNTVFVFACILLAIWMVSWKWLLTGFIWILVTATTYSLLKIARGESSL